MVLVWTFVSLMALGCSSSLVKSNKAKKVVKNEEIAELNQFVLKKNFKKEELSEAQQEADKKIEELILDAQKSGKEGVQYLASDLYFKATDASIRGDSQSAAFIYKYVAKLYPEDIYVQKKYAIELIRQGDLGEAEKILLAIFENKKIKREEDIGLVLGGLYAAMEQPDKARFIYSKILVEFPKSEEACVFLSKSLALEKKIKEAYSNLDRCQKKSAKAGIFSYYKGKIALSENNKNEAAKYFQEALNLEPSYYQAALGLGLIYEEKEKYTEAVKIYKSYLKKNTQQYAILSRLVQVLFATGKFQEVLPYAESLSNLDSSDLNLKVRLGILYSDSKRYSEAKRLFTEILNSVPDSDKILYYMAALEQQTGNIENAIGNYNKINEQSPLYGDAQVQVATLMSILALDSEENDKKVVIEKRLVSFINSKSDLANKVELYAVLANYYESENRIGEAVQTLINLKSEKAYLEEHDYYLATLYEKLGDYKSSRQIVSQIVEKNPENPHALNFLGYSYIESGENLDQAFGLISKAVKLRPEDAYIRDSLGWYHYKTGNIKKALVEIKKAFGSVKNDVVITKHLAIIYGELKNYELAKKYFLEALKNCKLDSERNEVITAIQKFEPLRLPASLLQEIGLEKK